MKAGILRRLIAIRLLSSLMFLTSSTPTSEKIHPQPWLVLVIPICTQGPSASSDFATEFTMAYHSALEAKFRNFFIVASYPNRLVFELYLPPPSQWFSKVQDNAYPHILPPAHIFIVDVNFFYSSQRGTNLHTYHNAHTSQWEVIHHNPKGSLLKIHLRWRSKSVKVIY
jgi:hypothetical protein